MEFDVSEVTDLQTLSSTNSHRYQARQYGDVEDFIFW